MGGKTDELKGRIKEAAGALIDNDELRTEGKVDQAFGKAERAAQETADKAAKAAADVADKAKKVLCKACE